ncbi:hypothetical protein K7W03_01435 [Sphingobium sp. PNB]|uniref:hypothetical protein n=1 Tax=Sphingobium sp. PNB TaxID=863934 RepID=UPI001CA3C0DE|nr:hypothetical protein [Sphingobium sp. PNB]MCB4858249.1 hypothetical protein [Sphingobium sp. PNB]
MKCHALLLSAGIAICLPAVTQAQTMEERARSAATASRTKTGDSDALQSNYLTPSLAGQPVSTIDNSKSFAPNIACQKTATLLELLAQPASTGDIGTLRISRDKDLDGSFDETLNVPVPVSGICANGIISCAPGSWNQCHPFQWEVGSSGNLKLGEVDLTALAGCYCVNNSCGANLSWGNMASILKDLGGGVVGALTTADPRIGVAQASIDGPLIRYTGAQTTACTAQPQLSATSYRSNPTAIQGDAYSVSQASSVFQTLAGSAAGNGKAQQTRNCAIERDITVKEWGFDDVLAVRGSIAAVTSCGTGCRRYEIRGSGTCGSVPPIYSATFDPLAPARIRSARIVEMGADDWVQARVNGQIVGYAGKRPWLGEALPSGDCRISDDPWYNRSAIDITSQLRSGATIVGARVRGGGDGNWGYVTLEVQVDTSCEVSERLVDLCSGYAADPACHLVSETVDGVVTFRNGVNTGIKPLPSTRLFGTGACSFQYTRDFFERARQYACVIDQADAGAPDLSRGAYIIDHSTETLLADRTTDASGMVSASTRPFSMPERGSVTACEPICKTRAPKANSDVAIDGVVGVRQNDPAGWDIFYHSCSADNVCPLGQREELVSACGCLDDFPEAVVMMQSVRLAGADLVCTAETR